jgi:hypothetical protein
VLELSVVAGQAGDRRCGKVILAILDADGLHAVDVTTR